MGLLAGLWAGCHDAPSMLPDIPFHLRLELDPAHYQHYIEGWLLVPPGYRTAPRLGVMSYGFHRSGDDEAPSISLVVNVNGPGFDFSNPCAPRSSIEGARVIRREELADGFQLVCDRTDNRGRHRSPDIVRIVTWGDVQLACEVLGPMSKAQVDQAWNICATMHMAMMTKDLGYNCRDDLDAGVTRDWLPGCDDYLPTPKF